MSREQSEAPGKIIARADRHGAQWKPVQPSKWFGEAFTNVEYTRTADARLPKALLDAVRDLRQEAWEKRNMPNADVDLLGRVSGVCWAIVAHDDALGGGE